MFEIKENRNGQYYITITGTNGERLYRSSESYTQKHNAIKSIQAVGKLFFPRGGAIILWDRTKSMRKGKEYLTIGWGTKPKG